MYFKTHIEWKATAKWSCQSDRNWYGNMLKYERILIAVLKLVALRLLVCSWHSKQLELQLAYTSGYWQVSYATVLCKWLG